MATIDEGPVFDARLNFKNTGTRNYHLHRIHEGDTCISKRNHHRVGTVLKARRLERDPPRRTVRIQWLFNSQGSINEVETVLESELEVVDRDLGAGDTVKLKPDDAESGTVIEMRQRTNLLIPTEWSACLSSQAQNPTFPTKIVHDVDARNLVDTSELDVERFIHHRGWLGYIDECVESVAIRLPNNSVVRDIDIENILEVYPVPSDKIEVGDFVRFKRDSLRDGTFLFGGYDANVAPLGFVVERCIESIVVTWLEASPGEQESEAPPDVLYKDELTHINICGTHEWIHSEPEQKPSKEWPVGEKVRLRNPHRLTDTEKQLSNWIPRQNSLGFDINTFTVTSSLTLARVQWQSGHVAWHPSVALTPITEWDEEEVWVGDLVTTRASRIVDGIRAPSKAGIVQYVRSRDRIAAVKWFEGRLLFLADGEPSLAPGSWTGRLSDMTEEVSLYDIWVEPGLQRTLGDIVTIITPFGTALPQRGPLHQHSSPYADIATLNNCPPYSLEYQGEIFGLGANGLLTVHLGFSANPRNVQIPWECTHIVYNSNEDAEESEEASTLDGYSNESADIDYQGLSNVNGEETDWVDSLGRPIGNNSEDEGWSTDEDNVEMTDAPALAQDGDVAQSASQSFSYETLTKSGQLSGFSVLEGGSPRDHHFRNETPGNLTGSRLRRIQKEHKILATSLPAGVFVRAWEAELHLLRVLILGPIGTPYQYAPFVVDMCLDDGFPNEPPRAFFHSWTDNSGPVNPNLYEDGKICLSLLGTWPGDGPSDGWKPEATILQVLVSLLGLVLVEDPYYNEAGFEDRAGLLEAKLPAAQYAERSFLKTRTFLLQGLDPSILGFESELESLYLETQATSPMLLARATWDAIGVIRRSTATSNPDAGPRPDARGGANRILSVGGVIPLRRTVDKLIDMLTRKKQTYGLAEKLQQMLDEPLTSHTPSFEELINAILVESSNAG